MDNINAMEIYNFLTDRAKKSCKIALNCFFFLKVEEGNHNSNNSYGEQQLEFLNEFSSLLLVRSLVSFIKMLFDQIQRILFQVSFC